MESVSEIARRLADMAEAVCRTYLSNGRREGRYWLVGNVHNARGRSLYVRLTASDDGQGQAGKWTDAESGEHGDLLDIIAASCGHWALRETLIEARRFLSLPLSPNVVPNAHARARAGKAPTGTPEAARRLWAAAKPLAASLAADYLSARRIDGGITASALRFHPSCWYRRSADDAPDTASAWPALIAAVTDEQGQITGVHRTWLDPSGGKAPVACPRRAMGHLLGHGVRFGKAGPVMAAGEGIETILSLRELMPGMPMIAGLSAAHLAAVGFPSALRRLYVARDDDPAGTGAVQSLSGRAVAAGIEIVALDPELDDFNGDLCAFGRTRLGERLTAQLVGDDAALFLTG